MAEGKRRLAAIMFTDMVGYTALGQRNESLSLALVEEHRKVVRPILKRHNGREVKTIGDSFMVEFPSALDAVRCAYDIQRAVREFNISLPEERRVHLRVGVHLGDVVETDGDISGDAVNIASRIESIAEDGGVCLTRQVYDHIQNKFDLRIESLGNRSLKNVGLPVEVFRLQMPWSAESWRREEKLERTRVAVLPFANMSSSTDDGYFADGMTEELITTLSGVSELTVIARTSVMRYRGSPKGASEIGRDLNVGALVEGSVRKAGNRVRITVQLIDTNNEGHLWAQNYDRQLDDIFAIQTDVARQVVDALEVKLVASETKKLERPPTSNIEAYTLYLKGKYFSVKEFGSEEGFRKALAHYEEAVANDPKFALAYAEIALCYANLGFFGLMSSREAGVEAKEYIDKALSLDDSLAETHAVKGRVLRNADWDFEGAKREFEVAIKLNPNFASAYGALANLLALGNQYSEAIPIAERAYELDPVGDGLGFAATVYLYTGRYAKAAELFEKLLEINPDSPYARGNLGLAHIQLGIADVGLKELEAVASIKSPASQSDLSFAYGRTGRTGDLQRLLGELLAAAEKNPELSVAVAGAYANLGDVDNAIAWLERAYRDRVTYLATTNNDFVFERLRDEPRFKDLMRRVGWRPPS